MCSPLPVELRPTGLTPTDNCGMGTKSLTLHPDISTMELESREPKKSYSFPKEERLHHRSLVEGLFRMGKTFYDFPFRVNWRVLTNEELADNFRKKIPDGIGCLQMMVTVPKKKRKRAVDRVKMRRRIREAYRLHRLELRELVNNRDDIGSVSIGLIYIHDRNLDYPAVEEKMKIILAKLSAKIMKRGDN